MATDVFNDKGTELRRTVALQPYQVDSHTSGTVYTRYKSGTGVVLIMRAVTDTDVVTYTKAYDTWANRASADYVAIDA